MSVMVVLLGTVKDGLSRDEFGDWTMVVVKLRVCYLMTSLATVSMVVILYVP